MFEQRRYRKAVLAEMQVASALADQEFAALLRHSPRIRIGIEDGYRDKRSVRSLGIQLAQIYLVKAIESGTTIEERKRFLDFLLSALKIPNGTTPIFNNTFKMAHTQNIFRSSFRNWNG